MISLTTALGSVWLPAPAVICYLLWLPLGLASASWRLVARLLGRWGRMGRLLVWASGMLAFVGVAALLVRRSGAPAPPASDGSRARCALTGYSTAADSGLRKPGTGTGALLGRDCAACAGSTVVRARPGATFRFIRDLACDTPWLLPRNGKVIFLGGSNDDFLSWLNEGDALSGMIRHAYTLADNAYSREASLAALDQLFQQGAEASSRTTDLQARLIDNAVRCAHGAGNDFIYVHDLLVLDLAHERSPTRREMLGQRRAAVESAGGEFLDLADLFRGHAGVSWFNDFIHTSVIGHRHIADQICPNMDR